MHGVSKLKLAEVTPYLVCKLCNGYFIDPCTAQDCLHTFCKTCIVKHLFQHCTCPICGVVIHKTRPLEMIRHDQTMQDLVYKLVPGVFSREMEQRRKFYADHMDPDPNFQGNSEERGEAKEDREILAEDDCISMALVHSPNGNPISKEGETTCAVTYLRCPANFTISGLKKLIQAKYDLSPNYMIDVFHSEETLSDDYTLMDIAYIYTWKRRGPLRVFFSIYQFDDALADQKLSAVSASETQPTGSVIEISESVTITELVKPLDNPLKVADNAMTSKDGKMQFAENAIESLDKTATVVKNAAESAGNTVKSEGNVTESVDNSVKSADITCKRSADVQSNDMIVQPIDSTSAENIQKQKVKETNDHQMDISQSEQANSGQPSERREEQHMDTEITDGAAMNTSVTNSVVG